MGREDEEKLKRGFLFPGLSNTLYAGVEMFQTVYLCLVKAEYFLPVSTNIQLEQYYFNIILLSLFKTQLGWYNH